MTQVQFTNRETNEVIIINPADLEGVMTKSYKVVNGKAYYRGPHLASHCIIADLQSSATVSASKFKAIKVLFAKRQQLA